MRLLLVTFMLFTQGVSHAFHIPGIESQHISPLTQTDPTLAKTGLSINEDDITSDQNIYQIKLSDTQIHEAQVWGLTQDEEKRYVALMQNKSALYYDGLRQTPLDILGINARDEAERIHFAELSARAEAQKVAKNIAWDNAFRKAYNELFKNVPVVGDFDASPFAPNNYQPITLNSNDQLYWFIKQDHAIKTVLLPLLEAIQTTSNTTLHLMLMDATDIDIQQWANLNQIPRELVSAGRITLNHGELSFKALTIKNKTTPMLLLARNGESHVVDLGRF